MPAPLSFILIIALAQFCYALYLQMPLPKQEQRKFFAHEDMDEESCDAEDNIENAVETRDVVLIEEDLDELPTSVMEYAIYKSTLSPEELQLLRVQVLPGALPGEILDELPIEALSLNLSDADEEHVHVRIED